MVLFVCFNTFSLYRQSLASLYPAYDRTLLESTQSIRNQLDARGSNEHDTVLLVEQPCSV